MVGKVRKAINKLGNKTLKPTESSLEYRSFLEADEKEMQKAVNELYKKSEGYLTPKDTVVPEHTKKTILEMRDILDADITSPASKKIMATITELGQKWGILPESLTKTFSKETLENPETTKKILDAFAKGSPPIHASRLEGVKKQLNNMYDPDAVGFDALINKLTHAVKEDLMTVNNPNYVNSLKEADSFFKRNIADRFRQSLGRGLLKGEAPVEAYNKMTSVDNIRLLKKIAGESPQGQEVFNNMAKTKATELLSKSFTDEGLSSGNFFNTFTKENKSSLHTQELLAELLGSQEYKKMEEIAKIAGEFKKSGQELLNASGTAFAKTDIDRVDTLVKSIMAAVIGGGSGAALAGPKAALTGAAISIVTPYVASRVLSNKNVIESMRKYALARQAGKEKQANAIMNNLLNHARKEAKIAIVEAGRQQNKGEKE